MTSGEGCSSSDARTDEGLRLGFTVGLSGFAALLYETVWIRLVGDVFGHTAYAVHTVLGLFFAGMALGSYATERVRGEPGRLWAVYASVEVTLAILGLIFPGALPMGTALHDRVAPFGADGMRMWFGRKRNRVSDLVGLKVDRRGRLIGEAWVPTAGLDADEWELGVLAVARTCDRIEYLLTGRDED